MIKFHWNYLLQVHLHTGRVAINEVLKLSKELLPVNVVMLDNVGLQLYVQSLPACTMTDARLFVQA